MKSFIKNSKYLLSTLLGVLLVGGLFAVTIPTSLTNPLQYLQKTIRTTNGSAGSTTGVWIGGDGVYIRPSLISPGTTYSGWVLGLDDNGMLVFTGVGGSGGPQGPAGPQGPQGTIGPEGPAGPQGITGFSIVTNIVESGSLSQCTNTGNIISFYADVNYNFTYNAGTDTYLGQTIVCQDGAQGPIGPQGPAGADGTNGQDGQDGVFGTGITSGYVNGGILYLHFSGAYGTGIWSGNVQGPALVGSGTGFRSTGDIANDSIFLNIFNNSGDLPNADTGYNELHFVASSASEIVGTGRLNSIMMGRQNTIINGDTDLILGSVGSKIYNYEYDTTMLSGDRDTENMIFGTRGGIITGSYLLSGSFLRSQSIITGADGNFGNYKFVDNIVPNGTTLSDPIGRESLGLIKDGETDGFLINSLRSNMFGGYENKLFGSINSSIFGGVFNRMLGVDRSVIVGGVAGYMRNAYSSAIFSSDGSAMDAVGGQGMRSTNILGGSQHRIAASYNTGITEIEANAAKIRNSTIIGGFKNNFVGWIDDVTILGGSEHNVDSTINGINPGNYDENNLTGNLYPGVGIWESTIIGGFSSQLLGNVAESTIIGGQSNIIRSTLRTGDYTKKIFSGETYRTTAGSTILSSNSSEIIDSKLATIIGPRNTIEDFGGNGKGANTIIGADNSISNSTLSIVLGWSGHIQDASNTFLRNDGINKVSANTSNTFNIFASSGVGINTTNPEATLHINGSTKTNGAVYRSTSNNFLNPFAASYDVSDDEHFIFFNGQNNTDVDLGECNSDNLGRDLVIFNATGSSAIGFSADNVDQTTNLGTLSVGQKLHTMCIEYPTIGSYQWIKIP